MNEYIGNNSRQRAKDRHGGHQFLTNIGLSVTSCVDNEGPTFSIPEHPKRPLTSSMIICYGAWA